MTRNSWNNVERGHPLSKEVALLLVNKCPGVTLDWLFLGKVEGLTLQMARALGVLEGYPASPPNSARDYSKSFTDASGNQHTHKRGRNEETVTSRGRADRDGRAHSISDVHQRHRKLLS
jgi:hypothetical protein